MRGWRKRTRLHLLRLLCWLLLMTKMMVVVVMRRYLLNRRGVLGSLGHRSSMPVHVMLLLMVDMLLVMVLWLSSTVGVMLLLLLNRVGLQVRAHAGVLMVAVMLAMAALALIKSANKRHGRRATDHRRLVFVRGWKRKKERFALSIFFYHFFGNVRLTRTKPSNPDKSWL